MLYAKQLGAGVAGESRVVEVLGRLGIVSPASEEGASIGCAMPDRGCDGSTANYLRADGRVSKNANPLCQTR